MSNYELQSELNSLQYELRQAQQINSELRSELAIIANGVSNAHRELEDYNLEIRNAMDNCSNSMNSSHRRVIDAVELQGEIEALYTRFKHIELANKKIRMCNNKKYYDFANYRTVRKIVQGIMDNIDIQMVSDRTITKSVERQHLQTPDYWLTCALISIMAWRNNDKELADRAIARAIRLDKKSSAVFYMLFNLRMKRNSSALKWFYTYQECELKGSDQRTFLMLFSLISKTLADNVDDNIKNEIFTFIKKVIDANAKAAGYSEEEIINQIKSYLNRMVPTDKTEFMTLQKYCKEFEQSVLTMMLAKNNINILEFILKTTNVSEEQRNTFLKDYIDELIAAPNKTEKEVHNEIDYNELIIRLDGDVDTAKIQFEAEQTKKANNLNLIAEMIDWIYERNTPEVNGQIRFNLFTLTKEFHEKAVEAYVESYRKRRKNNYAVAIEDYSTTVNFNHEDEEHDKILAYYTKKKDDELTTIKAWPAYIGFGVGAAALAGSFFAGFWLLIGTACGVGYGLFKLISNKSRKKQIEQKYEKYIESTDAVMGKLFAEFKQYNKELNGYDAYYERIKDAFAKV